MPTDRVAERDRPTDDGPALIIVRHGETEWSASGQHTGRTDVDLTETGRRQARCAGQLVQQLLQGREPGPVISSPRSRARDTALLAGFAPTEVTEDAGEWDYGELEGRTTEQIRQDLPGWTVWAGPVPGGETADQVSARADAVLARCDPKQPLLVFSHGHFSRCLAARWLGQPVTHGRFLQLGTGAVCSLGFEHDYPVVLRWNIDEEISRAGC